jgi:hypothetical protein
MHGEDDFVNIGKATPYNVPDNFFETISEKTLIKAKEREKRRKQFRAVWYTVSVAASLAAIVLLSYRVMVYDFEPELNTLVKLDTIHITAHEEDADSEIVKPIMAETQDIIPEKIKEIKDELTESDESIDEILSELSNEELIQLVGLFEADHFISDESEE